MLIFHNMDVSSQFISMERWKQPGLFFGASAGFGNAQIINKEMGIESEVVTKGKMAGSGLVEIGYFFSNFFGLTSGINYGAYQSDLYVESYQSRYNTLDRENEQFEMRIDGRQIEQNQVIDILTVPVLVNLRTPINKQTGIFLQAGINFHVPLENSYKSSGVVTFKGYFPAYNVLLENLPEYGFSSDQKLDSEGEMELNQLNYSSTISLGMDYLINKRLQLAVFVNYDRSFSEISNYSSNNDFRLITEAGDFNSLLSASNKIVLQTLAVKCGLRYYISDYTKFKYYYKPSGRKIERKYLRQRRMRF